MRRPLVFIVLVSISIPQGLLPAQETGPGCWCPTHEPCAGTTGSCRCPEDHADCPINYTKYLQQDLRYVDMEDTNTDDICYTYVETQIACWQIIVCPDAGELDCQKNPAIQPLGTCRFGAGEWVAYTYIIQGYWIPDGSCTQGPSPCVTS